jgi:hypothetical protein
MRFLILISCILTFTQSLVLAQDRSACNCEHCSFIEKEHLTDTIWLPEHRRGHNCKCEYTFTGKREGNSYKKIYNCDSWWFKEHYCFLPLPKETTFSYREPGTPGKTRLGHMGTYSDCGSSKNGMPTICNALAYHKWVDDVHDC